MVDYMGNNIITVMDSSLNYHACLNCLSPVGRCTVTGVNHPSESSWHTRGFATHNCLESPRPPRSQPSK